MDSSEPSTNGTSAANLYRLSSLLNDDSYSRKAKETIAGFESELLQYPWLFASFMPSIVAGQLGVKGVVVSGSADLAKIKEFEKQPRGGKPYLALHFSISVHFGLLGHLFNQIFQCLPNLLIIY